MCFSFSLVRSMKNTIRHHGDDSLFFLSLFLLLFYVCSVSVYLLIGAAWIFGTSPKAAYDRSCACHRKILHWMEGELQSIHLSFTNRFDGAFVFWNTQKYIKNNNNFWSNLKWTEEKILESLSDSAAIDVADMPGVAHRDAFPSRHESDSQKTLSRLEST